MPTNLGHLNNDCSHKIMLLLAGKVYLSLKLSSSNGDTCVFIFFAGIKKKRENGEGMGPMSTNILLWYVFFDRALVSLFWTHM